MKDIISQLFRSISCPIQMLMGFNVTRYFLYPKTQTRKWCILKLTNILKEEEKQIKGLNNQLYKDVLNTYNFSLNLFN